MASGCSDHRGRSSRRPAGQEGITAGIAQTTNVPVGCIHVPGLLVDIGLVFVFYDYAVSVPPWPGDVLLKLQGAVGAPGPLVANIVAKTNGCFQAALPCQSCRVSVAV